VIPSNILYTFITIIFQALLLSSIQFVKICTLQLQYFFQLDVGIMMASDA